MRLSRRSENKSAWGRIYRETVETSKKTFLSNHLKQYP
jgi:hypothetical protein